MNETRKESPNTFLMNFGKACGCHQIKERSFTFNNKQFFLCARCTGIFIGQLIIAPICYFLSLNFGFYTILFVIPMVLDGTIQLKTKYRSTNFKRLVTGLLGGYGIATVMIKLVILLYNIFF